MALIKLITYIDAPVALYFDLSRDIDLHRQSMAHTNERAINGVTSGLIGLYDRVTWQAKHFGVNMRMTVRISEMYSPDFFIDEMVKGPFKLMRHLHQFKSERNGTLMTDEFIFKSPLGILGKLADRYFLKDYMQALLVKRNQLIKQTAEARAN
ncbi:SRPBCC family protein [Mucilaginibacter glaciei]|uniref:SRPBCC family protein n=1 Tax=Mucilaginibacter glaciei TaxID=2772109 RepID=A0A926NN23_9SPHI|nr:SRPBCC family protein [Mucilaginibacter glaciei]MBD1391907.1 SRPBCC family protein [Mucilaginibacter glaciei]